MSSRDGSAWSVYLKPTLVLAWPIVVGNIGQILIGVVDTLMIGRVGVTELGAAAFVNNLLLIPLVTLMGLLSAVTVLLAQAKGEQDPRKVGRHIKHALAMAVGVSLLALGGLAANAWLLDHYGQEAEVVTASRDYYWLVIVSLVPALFYHCLKSVSEGLGWSNPPMLILLSGIGLNIALNWVFIFGNLGAPEMGLEGAGVATLIARTAIGLGILAFVLKAPRFRGVLPLSWWRRYEWAGFAALLKLGVPTAAQHLFEVGAFAGAGIIVGWISTEALAAHQIALSCAGMAFMIPLGVSIACGIRVGEAFGAKDFRKIRGVFGWGLGFTFLQTLVSASVFLLLGDVLAGWFVEDAAVVGAATSIFLVVGLFQIFDGAQVTCLGALRGMSDVTVPMWMTFVAYWGIALPVGYLLGIRLGYGADGVWAGLAAGLCCAAVSLAIRVRSRIRASL